MSTRCNIHFSYKGDEQPWSNIYRHYDGHPETVYADLAKFFEAVESEAPDDTRFDDPSYLAAKFVVWQARQYAKAPLGIGSDSPALRFTGVAPVIEDAEDGAYVFDVQCFDRRRPSIRWRRACETEWRTGLETSA